MTARLQSVLGGGQKNADPDPADIRGGKTGADPKVGGRGAAAGEGRCGGVCSARGRGGVGCGAVAAAGEGRARRRTERRRSGSREEKGLACQICRVRRLRTRVPDHVVLPILN